MMTNIDIARKLLTSAYKVQLWNLKLSEAGCEVDPPVDLLHLALDVLGAPEENWPEFSTEETREEFYARLLPGVHFCRDDLTGSFESYMEDGCLEDFIEFVLEAKAKHEAGELYKDWLVLSPESESRQ